MLALRSGERWRARLPELIEEADIFQLFWSSNSMRSRYCREEWEHALALRRPLFVRPLYWENPLPQDPAMGLPPAALKELEFVRVRSYPTRKGTPASSGELPDAGLGLGAPAGASPAYGPPLPGPGQLDAHVEAYEALSLAIADYGPRVLSDPRMLGDLVRDLLPDLPRERSLLVIAAEASVAGELTRYVQELHLDADSAVHLVALSLADRRSVDPTASMWVATVYAQALGYRIQSDASSTPPDLPSAGTTVGSVGRAGYAGPSPPAAGYAPAQAPAGGQADTGLPPQGHPARGGPTRAPKRRNLAPILAFGGTALIIAFYLIIAAIVHIAPFSP